MLYKNWRYKIYFNKSIKAESMEKFFYKLKDDRLQEIYRKVIDYYTSFYTVAGLTNEITAARNKIDITEIIDKAYNNIDKVIFLPERLVEFHESILKEMDLTNIEKEKVLRIISQAAESETPYDGYLELIKFILGDYYDGIKEAYLDADIPTRIDSDMDSQLLKGEEIYKFLSEKLEELYGDPYLKELFPINGGIEFRTTVNSVLCGINWSPKNLFSSKNEFLIETNYYGAATEEGLRRGIIREVYPGKGYLLNSVNKDKLVDYGFLEIYEGWSEYIEGCLTPNNEGIKLLKASTTLPFNDFVDSIYRQSNTQALLDLTQYIGNIEGPYWGKLLFDYRFNIKKDITLDEYFDKGMLSILT